MANDEAGKRERERPSFFLFFCNYKRKHLVPLPTPKSLSNTLGKCQKHTKNNAVAQGFLERRAHIRRFNFSLPKKVEEENREKKK